MDASAEGKGCEHIGRGDAEGGVGKVGDAGFDFTGDVGETASGSATGCDRIGESSTVGLLTFWSSGTASSCVFSSEGSGSGRNGSGKKRASGFLALQGTAVRRSFESYRNKHRISPMEHRRFERNLICSRRPCYRPTRRTTPPCLPQNPGMLQRILVDVLGCTLNSPETPASELPCFEVGVLLVAMYTSFHVGAVFKSIGPGHGKFSVEHPLSHKTCYVT